nr:FecR domain-containing protein [Halomonas socia]
MKTSHAPGADLDQAILLEAADWMVLMQSGEASDSDHAQLERWQAISPDHEEAWRRAEELLGALDRVPGKLARGALSRLPSPERRQILRLGLLLLAAPTASWLALRHTPWREWSADLRTATGEQRTLDLADGTRLVLNTASAVNVSLTASERRLTLLTGEILITTGSDPSPMSRPFIVQTSHGTLRALGTRFSARRLENATRAAVFEGRWRCARPTRGKSPYSMPANNSPFRRRPSRQCGPWMPAPPCGRAACCWSATCRWANCWPNWGATIVVFCAATRRLPDSLSPAPSR